MAQHLDVPSSPPAPADLQSAALPRQEEMSIKTRTMTLKKRIIKLVSKRKKGLPNLSLSNSKRYVLRIVSGGEMSGTPRYARILYFLIICTARAQNTG